MYRKPREEQVLNRVQVARYRLLVQVELAFLGRRVSIFGFN